MADEMRQALACFHCGKLRQPTPLGWVELQRFDNCVSLTIERDDRSPSWEEITSLSRLFGVPEGTEPNLYRIRRKHPRTGRRARYFVASLLWLEA